MALRPAVLIVVVGALLAGCTSPPAPDPADAYADQAPDAPRAAERTMPGLSGVVDAGWADEVAEATGIPRRALIAYAGAAIDANKVRPDCGIGWNTLAAIGFVESDHGRHDGATLGDDGTVSPPIFGPILDGGDTANIPDSDGGAIDGNSDYDRAVGPMQLIPESWANWGYDSNQDGVTDPQNIDDSTIAAANYLCRASDSDMHTPDGWRAGITAYNFGDDYIVDVADAAQDYYDASVLVE